MGRNKTDKSSIGPNSLQKKITLFFAIGVLLFVYVESANSSDEWQYWNEFVLIHNITQQLKTHIKFEQRFVDNLGEFGLHNYAPGLLYMFTNYFDFELNYKFEREKGGREWTNEHRLEIIPILKWKWSGIGFNLRNRLEYRDLEGEGSWRMREKIKIARPMNINGFAFKPYFSDEMFYDFKIGEFNQNRIAVGLSKELNHKLGMGLYYLYKSKQNGNDWSGANILGTEFVLTF